MLKLRRKNLEILMMLNVKEEQSCAITTKINDGDLTSKPGWVRMSIHPTMTDKEMYYIMNAIDFIAKNHDEMGKDYSYNKVSNEFLYKEEIYTQKNKDRAISWFNL